MTLLSTQSLPKWQHYLLVILPLLLIFPPYSYMTSYQSSHYIDLLYKRHQLCFHPWRIKPSNKRAEGWNQRQIIHMLSGSGYSGLERKRLAPPSWEGLLTAWLPWAKIKCSHMLDHSLKGEVRGKEKKKKKENARENPLTEIHTVEVVLCLCLAIQHA